MSKTDSKKQTEQTAAVQNEQGTYIAAMNERMRLLLPGLNEKLRRLVAAAEARVIGRGGIAAVSRATNISPRAIAAGLTELDDGLKEELSSSRVRRPGGGRKSLSDTNPTLVQDLEKLVEPTTRGNPESPLRWTVKSTRRLAEELQAMGHKVSHSKVAQLLDKLGYSLQCNEKALESASHEDRNDQFEHINAKAKEFLAAGEPVISVDSKKKENIGQFKNAGGEWQPKGQPERVDVHDFPDPQLGKVTPNGVYDQFRNEAWVTVGTDHDTASFAVQSIRNWWYRMGQANYPNVGRLLITADGGGSNGSRVRLWKLELQNLANELLIPISVCHYPPGTSKWNKIEHRLFSFITQNWRGKPLVSHETVVQLIRATTTKKGLKVRSALDTAQYPVGQKVSDKDFAKINIFRDDFHGEWNYTIYPTPS